jgi:hypothetical protein
MYGLFRWNNAYWYIEALCYDGGSEGVVKDNTEAGLARLEKHSQPDHI